MMHGYEFSYLLKSVPKSVAESYLKETFKLESPKKEGSTVFLFFSYGDPSSHKSYQKATVTFPASCFIFQSDARSNFVIFADQIEFYKILSWAKEQSCQMLIGDLDRKLNSCSFARFQVRNELWDGKTPKVMAILNITPDSFYDGGKYLGLKDYGEVAAQLIKEGADIIDIGGESTRPGSQSVSYEEEIQRVLPAVQQIRNRFDIPISVDTIKPQVASVVLSNGADMINDTSGLSAGLELLKVIKENNASYCLMHTQGTPEKMQQSPNYQDVLAEIYEFFLSKLKILSRSGLAEDRVCIDPGIGFGKQLKHNLNLLRFLSAFSSLNRLILLGTSNKSFIGQVLNRDPENRLAGTLTTQIMGWLHGAGIFRVHDVKSSKDSLKMTNLYINTQSLD